MSSQLAVKIRDRRHLNLVVKPFLLSISVKIPIIRGDVEGIYLSVVKGKCFKMDKDRVQELNIPVITLDKNSRLIDKEKFPKLYSRFRTKRKFAVYMGYKGYQLGRVPRIDKLLVAVESLIAA